MLTTLHTFGNRTRKMSDFFVLTKRTILSPQEILTKYFLKKTGKKTGNITKDIDTIAYGK